MLLLDFHSILTRLWIRHEQNSKRWAQLESNCTLMPYLFHLTTRVLHKDQTTYSPKVTAKIKQSSVAVHTQPIPLWTHRIKWIFPSVSRDSTRGADAKASVFPWHSEVSLLHRVAGHSTARLAPTQGIHLPRLARKVIHKAEVKGQDFSLFHVPQSTRCPGAKPLFLVHSRILPAVSGKGQHLPTFPWPALSSWAGLRFPQIITCNGIWQPLESNKMFKAPGRPCEKQTQCSSSSQAIFNFYPKEGCQVTHRHSSLAVNHIKT